MIRTIGIISALTICALLGTGCGSEGPVGECPPNSSAQQSSGGFLLSGTCNGCHSENLQGADRAGAPVGVDFDTPALIKAQAEAIYNSVLDGSMPPGGGLNELQIENLRVFLACIE